MVDEQFQFESKKHAADSIKSAARVFGAAKCGSARRDKRWDYDPLYDAEHDQVLSWEKDFPFEPKTVIVMLVPMDYDCMATAPAWTADGIGWAGGSFLEGVAQSGAMGLMIFSGGGLILMLIFLAAHPALGQLVPDDRLIIFDGVTRPGRVLVSINVEDDLSEYQLPAGAKAYVAVYSETWKPVAMIRQVILRVMSWENYPFSFMA